MDLFNILSLILASLGIFISALQVTSPRQILKGANAFSSFINKLLPSLSSKTVRNTVVLLMGVILIGTFLILESYILSPSQNHPAPPTPTISKYTSNTDIPNVTMKLEWDKSVTVNHSMSIALDITPSSTSNAITDLTQKFGSNYTVFIVTQLDVDGSTFTAVPKDQMQQPIEQGTLSFHWIATPLHSGDQAVDIIVKAILIPLNGNNKQIEYYLGSRIWHISVADDSLQPIVLGQVNISQVLSYLGSVFVSVAFIQLITTSIENRKKITAQNTQPSSIQSLPLPIPSAQPPTATSPSINTQQDTQQPIL